MERANIISKGTSKLRLAIALTGVLGAGSLAFAATTPVATPASSGGTEAAPATKCVPDPNPICYQIYQPVICSNGKVYTNQCYANADCAKGCVPYNNPAS
jgi:hypothetical protein